MKKCINCNKPIERSPRANNVKYCKTCRIDAYKYTEYRTAWQRTKRDRLAETVTTGKLKCFICGKYYRKPISHAYQVHGVNEREYKEALGLDHKKGLIPEDTREILRDHVKANYDVVVKKNLLTKGKRSRFKAGDTEIGKYTRSPETMERLKQLYKLKKSGRKFNSK
jgi:hypothetical protein